MGEGPPPAAAAAARAALIRPWRWQCRQNSGLSTSSAHCGSPSCTHGCGSAAAITSRVAGQPSPRDTELVSFLHHGYAVEYAVTLQAARTRAHGVQASLPLPDFMRRLGLTWAGFFTLIGGPIAYQTFDPWEQVVSSFTVCMSVAVMLEGHTKMLTANGFGQGLTCKPSLFIWIDTRL